MLVAKPSCAAANSALGDPPMHVSCPADALSGHLGTPVRFPMPLWLGMVGSAATRARARSGPKVWTARVPPGKKGCSPKGAKGQEKEEKGAATAQDRCQATRGSHNVDTDVGEVSVVDLTGAGP